MTGPGAGYYADPFARALLCWFFAILPVIDVFALGGVLWGSPTGRGCTRS
jgi:hypothetical protein